MKKYIGLALSGGGVRAAAFHIGVLEKLHELKLLERIDVISTVSGGSITGAFYLTQKNDFATFKDLMVQNLKKSIEKRTCFNWRFISYVSRTARTYDNLYFKNKTFSGLSKTPKLIINATNLSTGKNWKFSQEYMGDWKIGYDGLVSSFKIADAVAASSAPPGILSPLKIKIKDYFPNPKLEMEKFLLCDGGVYDNQGTHALTSNYDKKNFLCDYIICSDASFPFAEIPTKKFFNNVLFRQNQVMMRRIRDMQFQDLIYGQYKDKIKKAYFAINWTIDNLIKSVCKQEDVCKRLGLWDIVSSLKESKISEEKFLEIKEKIFSILNFPEFDNYLKEEDVNFVSTIGTRLRSLTDKEINMLIQHGSTLCGFQVRVYLHELLSEF